LADNNEVVIAKWVWRVLRYDPLSGMFVWRVSPSERVRAGSVAGSLDKDGYRRIHIDGRLYGAHRLAWFHETGKWPDAQIDHRNLNRDDNRFSNLREATNAQNQANSRARPNNMCGLKGVSRSKLKWRSRIKLNGKCVNLGQVSCPAAAHFSYIIAANKYFGEYARNA